LLSPIAEKVNPLWYAGIERIHSMPDFPAPTWIDRAAINRANAQHSTGSRTRDGKLRSSLNALTHGLTGRTALLPSEDPAAHQRHTREFFDEYQPHGPTEKQLVQELVDTSWRLNRVPALEAELLARAENPPTPEAAIEFDIVDAHQAIAKLALYSHRLSRQFHKTLDQLRDLQAERRSREERDLKRAAALLEMHKVKGIPYDPAQDGFVFSIDQIETYSLRLIRLNQSRHIEHVRFYAPPARHVAG
jgi:hypothetical protein